MLEATFNFKVFNLKMEILMEIRTQSYTFKEIQTELYREMKLLNLLKDFPVEKF